MTVYDVAAFIYLKNNRTIKAVIMKCVYWNKNALNRNYNLHENKQNEINERNKSSIIQVN